MGDGGEYHGGAIDRRGGNSDRGIVGIPGVRLGEDGQWNVRGEEREKRDSLMNILEGRGRGCGPDRMRDVVLQRSGTHNNGEQAEQARSLTIVERNNLHTNKIVHMEQTNAEQSVLRREQINEQTNEQAREGIRLKTKDRIRLSNILDP